MLTENSVKSGFLHFDKFFNSNRIRFRKIREIKIRYLFPHHFREFFLLGMLFENTSCNLIWENCITASASFTIGTMGNESTPGEVKPQQGSMYFSRQHPEDDKKAIIESKFDKVDISNGLEWSLDGKTFYYIDSLAFKVEAFDYESKDGQISNRRTVFDLKENGIKGNPDGMTIDTRGHLWVAVFFAAKVIQ